MADTHTDLRVIKTRQNIRNALTSLMSEQELSDITITALCERAQINRKTFYRQADKTARLHRVREFAV